MKEALLEDIQRTASATSRGVPKRPMGWWARTALLTTGSAKARSAIGVSMTAGQTALTRMPLRAYSSAAVLVSPITACLLAAYVAVPAAPMRPATDDMLTIA